MTKGFDKSFQSKGGNIFPDSWSLIKGRKMTLWAKLIQKCSRHSIYKIIFVFFFWSNFEKFDRDYLTNMRLHIVDSHLFGKRDHFSKFQNCDLLSIMSKISNKCEFTICNLIFVRYLRSTELFWWSHVSNKYEIYI